MIMVLTWLAALAAAGVATELTARWWLRRHTRYYVWLPGMRLDIRQEPDLFPEVEPRVRFDVNADGERGGDVRAQEPGLYRILVAGGSSVECYALDQPTSWPGQLERLLNGDDARRALGDGDQPVRRVHVGNIGHSGVGAAELDYILERVLPNYERLDAIVIMVNASTVYHWLEDGAPAGREPSVVPESQLFARHPGQVFGWSPRASAVVEAVRRVRQAWLRPVDVKERMGAWLVAGRKMRAAAPEILHTVPDPTLVLEHFERHFANVLRRARAKAPRVLVVRQPWFGRRHYTAAEEARFWHGGAGKPWKETVTAYFSVAVLNGLLSAVDARVAAIAEALGVAHVDLRGHLNGGLRHYYDHDHFTPEGAAAAAHAIATTMTGDASTYSVEPTFTRAAI